jgi:hypothetical protein
LRVVRSRSAGPWSGGRSPSSGSAGTGVVISRSSR